MAVGDVGTDVRKKYLDCETFRDILNHTARSSVCLVIGPTWSARTTNFDLGRWEPIRLSALFEVQTQRGKRAVEQYLSNRRKFKK